MAETTLAARSLSAIAPLPAAVSSSLASSLSRLDAVVKAIPADRKGQARLVINLDGIGADVAHRINEHVVAAAKVARGWQGGTSVEGSITIQWEPEP